MTWHLVLSVIFSLVTTWVAWKLFLRRFLDWCNATYKRQFFFFFTWFALQFWTAVDNISHHRSGFWTILSIVATFFFLFFALFHFRLWIRGKTKQDSL